MPVPQELWEMLSIRHLLKRLSRTGRMPVPQEIWEMSIRHLPKSQSRTGRMPVPQEIWSMSIKILQLNLAKLWSFVLCDAFIV